MMVRKGVNQRITTGKETAELVIKEKMTAELMRIAHKRGICMIKEAAEMKETVKEKEAAEMKETVKEKKAAEMKETVEEKEAAEMKETVEEIEDAKVVKSMNMVMALR